MSTLLTKTCACNFKYIICSMPWYDAFTLRVFLSYVECGGGGGGCCGGGGGVVPLNSLNLHK